MKTGPLRFVWDLAPPALLGLLLFIMAAPLTSVDGNAANAAQPSSDNSDDDDSWHPDILQRMTVVPWIIYFDPSRTSPAPDAPAARRSAIPEVIPPLVERIDNTGYTTERGEPLPAGMKRTIWRSFKATEDGTIVLHTFGSDVDTILAVYTGDTIETLKKVASNDDLLVSGVPAGPSLLAFEGKENTVYRVQIGSKRGEEGTVVLSRTVLPAEGGLVAQLLTVNGYDNIGADYLCSANSGTPCSRPLFLLYNATAKKIAITASESLGGALTAPAAFQLAPGAGIAKAFEPAPEFDASTERTISGGFLFSARTGAADTARARIPGIVNVGFTSRAIDLSTSASPGVTTATLGSFSYTWLHLINNGAADLTGCYVASASLARTLWRSYDPERNKAVGAENRLFDIRAGQTVEIAVAAALRTPQLAFFGHDGGPVFVRCVGTPAVFPDFDVTSTGAIQPTTIVASLGRRTSVKVPPGGLVLDVRTYDARATANITARPRYTPPFDESTDASLHFRVGICPADMSDNACLRASADEIAYKARKKKSKAFKIAIRPPTADLPSPASRRVVDVVFEEEHPEIGPMIVGAAGVDVSKK